MNILKITCIVYSKNKTNHENTNYTAKNNNAKVKFQYACHICEKIGYMARGYKSRNFIKKKQNNKSDISCIVTEMVNNIQNYCSTWFLDSGISSDICSASDVFEFILYEIEVVPLDNKTVCIASVEILHYGEPDVIDYVAAFRMAYEETAVKVLFQSRYVC